MHVINSDTYLFNFKNNAYIYNRMIDDYNEVLGWKDQKCMIKYP